MNDGCDLVESSSLKQKTKILFMAVSKETLSGGQTMLLNILRNINKDKYEVYLIVQKKCPLSVQAKDEGIKVYYKPFNQSVSFALNNNKIKRILSPLLLVLSSNSYFKELKKENYDIIWCENLTMLLLAASNKFRESKVVANMWSNINSKLALRLISFISSYIIVEADFQKKKFKSIGRTKNISTVYSQIDPSVFTEEYTREIARDIMGFPNQYFIIGFLGGCRYSKGFDLILEIANELIDKRNINNIIFYVAGKTESDDLYNDFTTNNKIESLSEKIRIEDWISDKELFFKSIDLFISASRNEGLPGALREAMGFGIPVIATAAGGSEEVVGDTNYVIQFSNKESMVNEFADIIVELMQDRGKYLSASNYSKSRVEELFIGTRWIKKIESIFDGLKCLGDKS